MKKNIIAILLTACIFFGVGQYSGSRYSGRKAAGAPDVVLNQIDDEATRALFRATTPLFISWDADRKIFIGARTSGPPWGQITINYVMSYSPITGAPLPKPSKVNPPRPTVAR